MSMGRKLAGLNWIANWIEPKCRTDQIGNEWGWWLDIIFFGHLVNAWPARQKQCQNPNEYGRTRMLIIKMRPECHCTGMKGRCARFDLGFYVNIWHFRFEINESNKLSANFQRPKESGSVKLHSQIICHKWEWKWQLDAQFISYRISLNAYLGFISGVCFVLPFAPRPHTPTIPYGRFSLINQIANWIPKFK